MFHQGKEAEDEFCLLGIDFPLNLFIFRGLTNSCGMMVNYRYFAILIIMHYLFAIRMFYSIMQYFNHNHVDTFWTIVRRIVKTT